MMTENEKHTVKIKVIGVGGAGCNAINHMINCKIEGVDFVVANTDAQALNNTLAKEKINLGRQMLKGLGAGGIPETGAKAAIESEEEIRNILEETDLIFVVCGMGGGTGTGATPVICKIAQDMEVLVVAAVTKPFSFEGYLRVTNAKKGIEDLKKYVDSIIVFANDKLLEVYGNNPLHDSFQSADEMLRQAVQTITDLVVLPAKINLDFADIRSVFKGKRNAVFGIGIGSGKRKAIDATHEAVNSHLLEASIKGVKNAIVNFTGGKTTTLFDINDSIECIKKEAGGEIDIKFGLKINKEMGDKMIVSIIGTDFDEKEIRYANPQHIEQIRKNRIFSEENQAENNQQKADKSKSQTDEGDLPPFMQ